MLCPQCDYDLGRIATAGKPRSVPQHRRYFKMIAAFHHHWPEWHSQQFARPEHLRKWAQMHCGHYEEAGRLNRSQFGGNAERFALVASWLLDRVGKYGIPKVKGDDLVLYVPKSISFDKLPHNEAVRLMGDVEVFLETQTGLKSADVLKETERAA